MLWLPLLLSPFPVFAASSDLFAPGDIRSVVNANRAYSQLICYFGDEDRGCPPASKESPKWLADSLAAMKARDCFEGSSSESQVWATALWKALSFNQLAEGTFPKKSSGLSRGWPLEKILPSCQELRKELSDLLDAMEAAQFQGSLDGRGGQFIGKFRFLAEKMDEAVAGIQSKRPRKFKEAVLGVAWQAEDIKKLFFAPPLDEHARVSQPNCIGLEAYKGREPRIDAAELERLLNLGRNFLANKNYPKATKALTLALGVAEGMGKKETQQTLHAQLAAARMSMGNVDLALPEMERALALARERNDLFSERDLLVEFVKELQEAGRENDLRQNYLEQLERIQQRIKTAGEGINRGDRFFAQGRYEDAKREYLQSAQLGHALSYIRIGECELKSKKPEAAVTAFQEALRMARLQHRRIPEASALSRLASTYEEQGNPLAAIEVLESLVRLGLSKDAAALNPEQRWQLELLRPTQLATLESLYNLSERWERAIATYHEFESTARAMGKDDDALRLRIHLGRAYVAAGDPEKGVDVFADALRSVGEGEGIRLDTLQFLHRSLFSVNPYWTAELRLFAIQFNKELTDLKGRRSIALRDALAAARQGKDRLILLKSLVDVAADWESRAALEFHRSLEEGTQESAAAAQAVRHYADGLELAGRLKRQDVQIICWRGLARLYSARQEWDNAAEVLERALTTALWKDGRTLQEADPSRKILDSAIELQVGDIAAAADILKELSYAYLGQGSPITAVDTVSRSLAAEPGEWARIKTLGEFAKLLEVSGYRDQSVSFLEKLLNEGRVEGAPRLKATILVSLASVQRKTGGLGEDWALDRLEQAYNILKPRGLNTKDIQMLLMLGELRLKKGKVAEAVEAYEAAIAISEAFRAALTSESARLALMEKDPTHVLNYQIAIGGIFAAAAKDATFMERAFAAAEKARARVLLESLRGADLEVDEKLRKEETALTQRLGFLVQKGLDQGWSVDDGVQFASLQDRLSRLGEEIRRTDPRYADLRYSQPSDLAETKSVLKAGEALISYKFAGRDGGAWVFIIRPDLPARLYRLDAAAIAAALKYLPPPEPQRPTQSWEIVPDRLGKALWEPFAASLKDVKKVFIVPDMGLWAVPWSALNVEGEYLVDKEYTVQVVPSGSVLVRLRTAQREKSEWDLAAFAPFSPPGKAGPPSKPTARRVSSEEVPQLPGGLEVMESLRWIFPKAKVYLPPEATKEKAIAESGRYRYVLYYTHGLANETNPWMSHIFFTDENGRETALTVTEAMKLLKLDKTNLVVVSACESARGQLVRGEGVMGLTRGLFYAGARGVVATGWSVAERPSRDIVIGMFQGIHLGIDPAKALQKAQQDVRKRVYDKFSGENPYFWAGFQVYGDPE